MGVTDIVIGWEDEAWNENARMSKRRDGKRNSYINVSFQGENVSRFDGAHFPFLIKSFAEVKKQQNPGAAPEGIFWELCGQKIPSMIRALRREFCGTKKQQNPGAAPEGIFWELCGQKMPSMVRALRRESAELKIERW